MSLIAAIAQAMHNATQRLALVSHNVANQLTPGYRAARWAPAFSGAAGLDASAMVQTAGPMRETGKPLDLALEGPGFFALADDRGLFLTRAGAFQRGDDGSLVDAMGCSVLGSNGPIKLSQDEVHINASGDVIQAERVIDRLLVLSPEQGAALSRDSGGFRTQDSAAEVEAKIRQGALEGSNVDPAMETLSLLELTRHIESTQRALSIYDKAMETGINRLGENS